MELTLLAPTALSAACSKALAFWAAAGPTAGPSTRADTTTNVTSTFFLSLLPNFVKVTNLALRLSQRVDSENVLQAELDQPRRHRASCDDAEVCRPKIRAGI